LRNSRAAAGVEPEELITVKRAHLAVVFAVASLPYVDAQERVVQADPPVVQTPLTPGEKAAHAVKDTFSALGVLEAGFSGALDQWSGFPKGWGQGMEGYGKRVGSRWARRGIRNGIELGVQIPLRIEPRYDRMGGTNIGGRIGHAFRRTLVARRDGGGEMPNIPTFVSIFGTSAISLQWYPQRYRTGSHILGLGAQDLGWEVGNNLFREFWPDVKKIVFRR
jgi:hypothetical protein